MHIYQKLIQSHIHQQRRIHKNNGILIIFEAIGLENSIASLTRIYFT